jgi:hypothetical protein
MGSFRLSLALVGLYTAQALASCAHGTQLLRRAEAGEKPTFGYTGNIVSTHTSRLDKTTC